MKVTLYSLLEDDSRLFKQIIDDSSRMYFSAWLEVYSNKLAEPTGVIIFKSLGITKSFKQWIGV
jgi:hypothetical protein